MCAFASDNPPLKTPNPSIFQLQHTSWKERDGAPSSINDIAQAPDGSLWLGSGEGLYHFDGFSFERVHSIDGKDSPAPMEVYVLYARSNGDLWIGTSYHGTILLRNGEAKHLPDFEGVSPNTTVFSLDGDLDGNIWAGTAVGVQRFDGSQWHSIGKLWGLPAKVRFGIYSDTAGTVWAESYSGGSALFKLKRGSHRFERVAIAAYALAEVQSPSGETWISTHSGVCLLVAPRSAPGPRCAIHNDRSTSPPLSTYYMLNFDRRGNLWMRPSKDTGIERMNVDVLRHLRAGQPQEKVESFTERDGLTSNNVRCIFRDRRDGSTWLGTEHGLDHFRDPSFLPEDPNPSGVDFGVQPQRDGRVWISSMGSGLSISSPDGKARPIALDGAEVGGLFPAQHGGLWFTTIMPMRIGALDSGKMTSLPLTPELQGQVGVQSIVEDSRGALWVSFIPYGLAKWENGRWIKNGGLTGLPDAWVVILSLSPDGRIWAGYFNGEAAVIDGTSVQRFAVKDGLNIGPVSAILSEESDCWLAGVNGLVRFDGQRFQLLSEASNRPFTGITGIVKARSGDLWLNAWDGVRHIPAAELARAEKDPGFAVHSDLYDRSDGLPGVPQRIRPFPTAVLGTDGRIWIGLHSGVVSVDPQDPSLVHPAPPVSIVRTIADGKNFDSSAIRLAPRTKNLEIDYTAVSLNRASRVRFRYKLEGMDTAWQNVGTRRQALYNSLPPGNYQFHVSASNGDDLWNEAGATMNIVIPPAFNQTTWFRMLCAVAFVVLLWGLYEMRLHQIRRQFNIGLEARINERTRIARELHDTLLQRLHGLMFEFQAARNMLQKSPHEALLTLDDALMGTEQAITESQEAIEDLRDDSDAGLDIAQRLRETGEELVAAHGADKDSPTFGLTVEGQRRNLVPIIREGVYRIACEVVRNAFRHAQAHRIEVEILYSDDQFRARVRDDGKGMDPEVLEKGGRAGHWGLPGIRERAQQMGAKVDIWSEVGAGTEVQLAVDASVAYEKTPERSRFRLFRGRQSHEHRS
jgi:signal transduction histidine kinase/ligand-binding sensor domain-containing protein